MVDSQDASFRYSYDEGFTLQEDAKERCLIRMRDRIGKEMSYYRSRGMKRDEALIAAAKECNWPHEKIGLRLHFKLSKGWMGLARTIMVDNDLRVGHTPKGFFSLWTPIQGLPSNRPSRSEPDSIPINKHGDRLGRRPW